MSAPQPLTFNQPDLAAALDAIDSAELDTLDFGVIGFDGEGIVRRFNEFESKASLLSTGRVLAHPLFTVVAPCMNNFMVAQRFEDARANGSVLDMTIPYVLTLRMRPTKVQLRLLATPVSEMRYVLVHWIK